MPSNKERVQGAGCLVIILIFAWWGFWGLKTALFEREPTRLSFSEYARQPVEAHWIELSDVQADFRNLVWVESLTGSIEEVYVPLQPRTGEALAETPAVLFAKEGDLVALASWFRAAKDETSGPELERAGSIIAELDQRMQKISGMVVTGLDKGRGDDRALRKLYTVTTSDPKIIEWNQEPSFGFHLIILLVSLFFAIGALGQIFGKGDGTVPELRESD